MAERNDGRSIAIRPARLEDRAFVLSTAARLAEFGPPPWRTVDEVVAGESRAIRTFFENAPEGSGLLIAEDARGRPLGFAYLETQLDFFTRRPHAHLAELAVAREAEGLGAGGALLSAVGGLGAREGLRRPDAQRLRRQSARPRRLRASGLRARDRPLRQEPWLRRRRSPSARPGRRTPPELARLSTQLGYPMSAADACAAAELIAGHPDHALLVAAAPATVVAGWIQVSLPRIFESPVTAEIAGLVVDEERRGGRDRRVPRRFRGRLGAGTRLPGAPRAHERDPRARARVLRARGVRPPQDTARPRKAPRGPPRLRRPDTRARARPKNRTRTTPARKPPMCAPYATPPHVARRAPAPLKSWKTNQTPIATIAGTCITW